MHRFVRNTHRLSLIRPINAPISSAHPNYAFKGLWIRNLDERRFETRKADEWIEPHASAAARSKQRSLVRVGANPPARINALLPKSMLTRLCQRFYLRC